MRIGIDVQTLETPDANRGIGKLCFRTIQLLSAHDDVRELMLFGRHEQPAARVLPLLGPRVSYVKISSGPAVEEVSSPGEATEFLWSSPEARSLDLYHVTSPLMPDIILPRSGPCPLVATLLDAIPAVMHSRGTPVYGEQVWEQYLAKVRVLRGYQGWLPISSSAAEDCAAHLNLPLGRMQVTYVPVEQRPLSALEEKTVNETLDRFGLAPGFIVSVSGYHPRKNLDGMLRAYSRIPAELRRKHPLVLVCGLTPDEAEELTQLACSLKISQQFRMTNYVTDEQLVALVRSAGCFLFTSRYEGFGIPPAEALACGTPVVAGSNSSLPEVLGDAGLLVATGDEQGYADAVQRLLTTEELRKECVARGYVQVEKFSPDRYVERLLAGYRQAMSPGASPSVSVASATALPRIAVVSETRRAISAIREVEEQLLQELSRRCAVEWFSPASSWPDPQWPNLTRFPAAYFESRKRQSGFDGVLSYVGASDGSMHPLSCAAAASGVAVLRTPSPPGEVLTSSRALIVESDCLLHKISQVLSDASKLQLIRGAAEQMRGENGIQDRTAARRRWLLARDAFVVLYLGEISQDSRIESALEAYAAFHRESPNSVFLQVGPAEAGSLQRFFARTGQAGLKHCARVHGQVSPGDLQELMEAADVCLVLPPDEEYRPSAEALAAVSAGRPLLTRGLGQLTELPDDVCWKVRPGASERRDLLEYFRHLSSTPTSGEKLAENARRHAAQRSWAQVAEEYLDLLIAKK